MTKTQFGMTVVLGLTLSVHAQSQGTGQASTATVNDPAINETCQQEVQAYERQQVACADFRQQVSDLKVQIGYLKDQRRLLLEQCQYSRPKNAKPQASQDCDLQDELAAGRLSILQQAYKDLQQQGCPQTAVNPTYSRSCRIAAQASRNAVNQARADAALAKAAHQGKNQPINVSNGQQQVPRRDPGGNSGQTPPQAPRQPMGESGGSMRGPIASPVAGQNVGGAAARTPEPK
jgi:hypothetical protein